MVSPIKSTSSLWPDVLAVPSGATRTLSIFNAVNGPALGGADGGVVDAAAELEAGGVDVADELLLEDGDGVVEGALEGLDDGADDVADGRDDEAGG